jgi:hypothetical protein
VPSTTWLRYYLFILLKFIIHLWIIYSFIYLFISSFIYFIYEICLFIYSFVLYYWYASINSWDICRVISIVIHHGVPQTAKNITRYVADWKEMIEMT